MMRSSKQQFKSYWQLFTATSLATDFLTPELSFARPWTGRQVQHRGFVRRGWPHHRHHHNRHCHHKPQNTLLAHHKIQSTSYLLATWQGSRRWTRSWTRRPAWRRTCLSSRMVATTCSAKWGQKNRWNIKQHLLHSWALSFKSNFLKVRYLEHVQCRVSLKYHNRGNLRSA